MMWKLTLIRLGDAATTRAAVAAAINAVADQNRSSCDRLG